MRQWLVPLAGMLIVAGYPLVSHLQRVARETKAERRLTELRQAQEAFRAGDGGGGYATALASLTTRCPAASGTPTPAIPALGGPDTVNGYVMTVRAAASSRPVGVDCHGQPTSSDYYAAVAPVATDGRRAFAMTSDGRVYVFFDGVAPTETDMAPGGTATPREALDTFKIP